jgi:flagellar motor switch protein FliM
VAKILSQDEIDALLTSAKTLERRSATPVAPAAEPAAVVYNFRRPDRVSKEQMRSLHFLHDRFARNVATSLSAYLRAATDISLLSVEQFTYSEVLMSLPDPTAFYAMSLAPLDGLAALEINPSVSYAVIDRMLGGSGQGLEVTRALTDIEQNVIDGVVSLLRDCLTEAWNSVVPVSFVVQGHETRPQMLQVCSPNEIVVLIVFEVKLGDARGMINLCVPATAIDSAGESFARGWHRTRREPTAVERSRLNVNLGQVRLPVAAAISSRIRTHELLDLRPGDVLSLGHRLDSPIQLRIGRTPKFSGRILHGDDTLTFATDARLAPVHDELRHGR